MRSIGTGVGMDFPEEKSYMMKKLKAPSLIDLCVKTVIDNLRYLGDVGETDLHLLDRILPHCTIDQLENVEKGSQGRDLSPVTDKLWKKFYEKEFGVQNLNDTVKRMKQAKVSFRWKQLYEAKLKAEADKADKACEKLAKLYKKEDARKQSRQVRICTKVPPSSKRSFWGGSGSGYNVSSKSKIMKKAKVDFLKSNEVKNIAAMKNNSLKGSNSSTPIVKTNSFSGKDLASTSKQTKAVPRRF